LIEFKLTIELASVFGTIISALATLTIAILTYLTLKEIKEQREQSIKPNLSVLNDKRTIYANKFKNDVYGTFFSWVYAISTIENTNERPINEIGLNIFNLGQGYAVEIEINFEFDEEQTLAFLKRLCSNNCIIEHESKSIVKFILKEEQLILDLGKFKSKIEIDFMSVSNTDSTFIKIPENYLRIYEYALLLADKMNIDIIEMFKLELPKLNIKLKYKSTSKNVQTVNYNLAFAFVSKHYTKTGFKMLIEKNTKH
jgi:hypothetical protein